MNFNNKIVCIRFAIEDANLIKEITKTRGQDTSSFVRFCVKKELFKLGYLKNIDERALGGNWNEYLSI